MDMVAAIDAVYRNRFMQPLFSNRRSVRKKSAVVISSSDESSMLFSVQPPLQSRT
jgi:hypothetical protein